MAAPAPVPQRPLDRRALLTETTLVLLLSLGASAIWSILSIINKLTLQVSLAQQTTAMNSAVTPGRPWLDLTYQLVRLTLALVPVALVLHLLRRDASATSDTAFGESKRWTGFQGLGLDFRRPGHDLLTGAGLAAVIGIPGLGLYVAARALNLNTTIAAANLGEHWWTVPVLILAALENAVLEEVVVVAYLFRRWTQAGWSPTRIIVTSALIRGSYHLYQGFGGFVGNAIMGLIFGWLYTRTKRVMPLVIAHTILDIVAFVGYALLRDHLTWL